MPPLEIRRKGWHMFAGLAATPLVLYAGEVFAMLVFLSALVFIASIELLHRYWGIAVPFWSAQLRTTRRDFENFSWASISFLLTLFLLLWLTPIPVALAGAAMLAFGDGFSALAGRAFGRHKIPYNRRKSWEGSLAGLIMGFGGAMVFIGWYAAQTHTAYELPTIVFVCALGAACAMIGESLPGLQDNVVVPIFAAVPMTVAWTLLRLTPAFGWLPERVLGR